MNKRLVLGILAAVLSLTLGIGGTLMLFTATTNTATNVVTLSNDLDALLLETHLDKDFEEGRWESGAAKSDDKYQESGIDYTDILPGQEIIKRPLVYNEKTSADAYVYVEGVLKAEINDVPQSQSDLTAAGFTEADKKAFLASIVATQSDNWFGGAIDYTQVGFADSSIGLATGKWYYVETNHDELKVLEPGKATPPIFKTVTVPVGLDIDNFKLTLELTAYLVQADYNPYATTLGTTVADWAAAFTN